MKTTKLISTITFASVLCVSIVNSLNVNEIKNLVSEYFDESIVNDLACIAYNEAINPKLDGSTLGLWNLKKEYCGSICKSICQNELDLMDIKLNTQCAELVYLENGLNGWDSYKTGKCDIENKVTRPHTSTSSRDTSSTSSRDTSSSSSSSTGGSGSSGTSGSNSGQTGHVIPGQSGHGIH